MARQTFKVVIAGGDEIHLEADIAGQFLKNPTWRLIGRLELLRIFLLASTFPQPALSGRVIFGMSGLVGHIDNLISQTLPVSSENV